MLQGREQKSATWADSGNEMMREPRSVYIYILLLHQFRSYNLCLHSSYQDIIKGLKECYKEPNNDHDKHNPGLDQVLSVGVVLHL